MVEPKVSKVDLHKVSVDVKKVYIRSIKIWSLSCIIAIVNTIIYAKNHNMFLFIVCALMFCYGFNIIRIRINDINILNLLIKETKGTD